MQAPPSSPPLDVLFFVSGSPPLPPGEGIHERVAKPRIYLSLPNDFRRKLSNFYQSPFAIECASLPACYSKIFPGTSKWNSVEHLFQGCKIALVDVKRGRNFCLDSGSELSKKPGLAARLQRKCVELDRRQLDRWDSIQPEVLHAGLEAKFSQNPHLRKLLCDTKEAALTHTIERVVRFDVDAYRQHQLEGIRHKLQTQQSEDEPDDDDVSTKPEAAAAVQND